MALQTSSSNASRSRATNINGINESVKGLGITLDTSSHGTRQLLEQLGDKMQELSDLSTKQSKNLNITYTTILKLLKEKSSARSCGSVIEAGLSTCAETCRELDKHGEACKNLENEEDGLQDALNRLCRLVEETDKTVFSEDAESFMFDLHQVFEVLSKVEGDQAAQDRKGKRRRVQLKVILSKTVLIIGTKSSG